MSKSRRDLEMDIEDKMIPIWYPEVNYGKGEVVNFHYKEYYAEEDTQDNLPYDSNQWQPVDSSMEYEYKYDADRPDLVMARVVGFND